MACPAIRQIQSLRIQQAIAAGNELAAAEMLGEHFLVETVDDIQRRKDFIFVADGLTHLDSLFEEHRQQGGGHRMADSIGKIKARVMLIQSRDIVDIA